MGSIWVDYKLRVLLCVLSDEMVRTEPGPPTDPNRCYWLDLKFTIDKFPGVVLISFVLFYFIFLPTAG